MIKKMVFCFTVLFFLISPPALGEEAKSQGGGGFLQTLKDVLEDAAGESLTRAMDEWLGTYKGRIGQVEMVERRGNSLVLDVTYENVKRADGVQVNGRVLDGGIPLDGFKTSLRPIQGAAGKVRLAILKKESDWGSDWSDPTTGVNSDQVELFLVREGHEDRPFGNLVYDLTKTWTNSEDPDELPTLDEEEIALADEVEDDAAEAGPTIVRPGTVLIPSRTLATDERETAVAETAAKTSPATLPAIAKIREYDFYENAHEAQWRSASPGSQAHALPFPGSTNDRRGFVRRIPGAKINPDNSAQFLLQTHPEWKDRSYIAGLYPEMVLDESIRFKATGAFLKGATHSDGATFVVQVYEKGRHSTIVRQRVSQKEYVALEGDLSPWAGKEVRIILRVEAGETSAQDWTVWVKPRLEQVVPVKTVPISPMRRR